MSLFGGGENIFNDSCTQFYIALTTNKEGNSIFLEWESRKVYSNNFVVAPNWKSTTEAYMDNNIRSLSLDRTCKTGVDLTSPRLILFLWACNQFLHFSSPALPSPGLHLLLWHQGLLPAARLVNMWGLIRIRRRRRRSHLSIFENFSNISKRFQIFFFQIIKNDLN